MMTTRTLVLLVIPAVLLLSACPVSPRSAGQAVGGALKEGQKQAEQFLQGARQGYSSSAVNTAPSEPNPNTVGEIVGRALQQGQKIAEQFLKGVKSGYQSRP